MKRQKKPGVSEKEAKTVNVRTMATRSSSSNSNLRTFINERRSALETEVKGKEMGKGSDIYLVDNYEKAMNSKELIRKRTGVIYDDMMALHECLWDSKYPENPQRYHVIIERCLELGLIQRCVRLDSTEAQPHHIESLHTQELYNKLAEISSLKTMTELEENAANYDSVYFNQLTFKTALMASGCAIKLVDAICRNEIQNGMAIIRPPGHHAMKDEYCGYCFFNNVALAAQYALDNNLAKKILIVDADVHHGQATQRMFYEDDRVLYFSIHRYEHGGFWPHLRESDYDNIGKGKGEGYNINFPLNVTGLGDSEYMSILNQMLLPVAYEFQPDLILISAGYDACLGCPEGRMEVTPGFYGHLVSMLSGLAMGKVAVCLEGGYFLPSLAEGAAMTLKSLLGDPMPMLNQLTEPHKSVQENIHKLQIILKKFWKCFLIERSNTQESNIKYVGVPLKPPFDTRECYLTNNKEHIEKYTNIIDVHKSVNDTLGTNQAVACAYDEKMLKHYSQKAVAEKPVRLLETYNLYKEWGLDKRCKNLTPKVITSSIMELVHKSSYVQKILEKDFKTAVKGDSFDMYSNKGTLDAVLTSAGCLLAVVDGVLRNEVQSGVALIRPPGHHAEADSAMGFCYLNNVAIAAQYAIKEYNLERVVIIDFDIHHGNGTQNLFYNTNKVLYISIHRYDRQGKFYPGTTEGDYVKVGTGDGKGFNINIPLTKDTHSDREYITIFNKIILPIVYAYAPQLVLVSAGFDAGVHDLLGNYTVSPECFGHLIKLLKGLAHGRLILALEGGYNPTTVKYSMIMCIKALLGDPAPKLEFQDTNNIINDFNKSIRKVIEIQKEYWPVLIKSYDSRAGVGDFLDFVDDFSSQSLCD